jgi:hypothetical protein
VGLGGLFLVAGNKERASMADVFGDFLKKPDENNFRALRDCVIASPEYDFHATDLDELGEFVTGADYASATALSGTLMPNWLLSPRAHQLLGHAADHRGDLKMAGRENYMARACLHGLLASGDGTELKPYAVTHVPDEYDVLQALGKQPRSQRLVKNAGGSFDVFDCADGSEVWFDISAGAHGSL